MKHSLRWLKVIGIALPYLINSPFGWASVTGLQSENIHTAERKKTEYYIRDGLFVGGDSTIDAASIENLRFAQQPAFERVVVDVDAQRATGATAISRAPYYQVEVSPDMKRVTLTVVGKLNVNFDAKKAAQQFKKSKWIEKAEILPKIEKDRWNLVLSLSEGRPIEVFELGSPVRVIIDLKSK